MNSYIKVLNLLDIPISVSKDLTVFYQHCLNNEEEKCNFKCCVNDEIKNILTNNLINKPYETSNFLRIINHAYKNKHEEPFEDIISAAILNYLRLLSLDNQNEIDNNIIYTLLSLLDLCELNERILNHIFTEIYSLIDAEKLNKDLVYLTLLPQKNFEIINKLLKYEKNHFKKCDINDSNSLFRYCLYKNRHWLFYIMENNFDQNFLNQDVCDKLFYLKLNNYINKIPIDYYNAENILCKISKNILQDRFIHFSLSEIKWYLEFYSCIAKINKNFVKKFKFLDLSSCLTIMSDIINLDKIEYYDKLNEILLKYQCYLQELRESKMNISESRANIADVDLYNGFCLLLVIRYYICQNENDNIAQQNIQDMLMKIKTQLFRSKNLDFQLEIFENLFAMLFLEEKHVKEDGGNLFICMKKHVHFIATFLKQILKEMKRNQLSNFDKTSRIYRRYTVLNNYVSDALWRQELLKSQNYIDNEEKEVINIMLSSANTLIYLCLENDNFEKAHDVVQMYKMQDTYIAQEIEFMEKMQYIKIGKVKDPEEIIKFCIENKTIEDEQYKTVFSKYENNEIIKSLNSENETFMNIIDAALTLDDCYETSKQLFDAVSKIKSPPENLDCDYLHFCYNILQIFSLIGPEENISASKILISSKYPLDTKLLQQQQLYYRNLKDLYEKFQLELANKHDENLTNEIFLQLSEFCAQNYQKNYLHKLYNYLKLFSKIFSVKGDDKDVTGTEKIEPIFKLLHINPSKIVGELLSENNVKPKDLEPLFAKLKLDLIYHIAWNCLPIINQEVDSNKNSAAATVSLQEKTFDIIMNDLKNVYEDDLNLEIKSVIPDVFLLAYIRKRNWLLAYLINKVYTIEEAKPDTNSDRTKYFINLLNLPSIEILKSLFCNNNTITVLYQTIPINKLLQHFEEIKIDDNCDWIRMIDIINHLPERLLKSENNLIHLKDTVLYNLINSSDNREIDKNIEYIIDDELRIKCILENLKNWPGDFCIDILNSQLCRLHLDDKYKKILRKWFYQIDLYENIKNAFSLESWNDAYRKSIDKPKEMFHLLLTSKQLCLLLKWIEIHKPTSSNLIHFINTSYFILILEEGVDLSQVRTLLDLLQFDQRIQICKNLIKYLKKILYLEFVVDYLVRLLPELESEYKNIMISLKIFSCFNLSEHEFIFCLINKPLLIIEQLIMNTRLEKLNNVMEKIIPLLRDSKDKNITVDITFDSIDALLRTYAKKSLDFRGIQPSAGLRNMELKLMQSLDTVSGDSERRLFIMPEKVPDKECWMQNEEALECMCCREVTFSMFNRRHHCRRCGRVICGSCSNKRMEIIEYGSLPVRVCNDCYKQSQPDDQNSSVRSEHSSNKSGSLTYWTLSDDERHNEIAREEFSYEYAPSVSLCLSILKSHSHTIEYPRFLLQECKILLPYLQDAINEIDFSFVIQMIKSLVTVAKVTSLHYSFKEELSKCNEILLHIEVLSLLVEKDCIELFRNINKTKTEDYYIDSAVLRRLRDKLLEQEQWPLALEVSTKAGLDKTGVFAAWGKSCLKAGCLQSAREKFQYCLEKSTVYEGSLDMSISISYDNEDTTRRSHLKSMNLSTVSENRPVKTPPIVNEIISVLESNNRITDRSVFKTFDNISLSSSTLSLNTSCNSSSTTYDPAICILNKLKNLKNIAANRSQQSQSRKNSRTSVETSYTIEPCFYNECLYYLMKYASHTTILHFYIRHQKIDDALNYVLENRLHSDIFIEIYMKCIEDGKVEILQEQMQAIDCTLNAWEVYLKSICCYLEKNSMLNVLYQLQQFMCDYVRAAMTCIKFYQENANSFTELLNREDFLHKAQTHLKQELEQEQWVQVSQVVSSGRKVSTASSGSSQSQPSLTMKLDPRNIDRYINTIWRQIEITKFLAECEAENRPTLEVLNEIFSLQEEKTSTSTKSNVPTLFDTQFEKTKLAVLALVCGKNVDEGFGIAFRIIQDHKLKYLKIYCLAGKYLAQILRETAVVGLVSCIQSSGLNAEAVNKTIDEVLMISVSALTKANGTGAQLENLIKFITVPAIKIDAYIESKQLKRAYLLAVRHNRNGDIKKILREAERQNQPQIKTICLKRLNQV